MSKSKNRERGKREYKGSGKKGGKSKRNRFISNPLEGKVLMSREGYAFISIEGRESELFVAARKLKGALHGDIVKVIPLPKRGERREEGEVIEIVKRGDKPFIGILHVAHSQAWVLTQGKNMPYDIVIPYKPELEQKSGEKVAAIVKEWPKRSQEPIGELIAILGKAGENETEMHAILTEFGLPYKFSKQVENAASKISEKITAEEIASRRDFREVTTFTIDPADAKDFDDALSIRELHPGLYEVGIHIADVTHYVKPGSILDREAYERATSVYLVDRTVPMLPEKLSNKVCSLRPNEEKLTFSALFTINEKGKVEKRWFGKSLIKSDHRFNYQEVQAILESGQGRFSTELLKLNSLATSLREERFAKGAINFERPDIKVVVDKEGRPIEIKEVISGESNWLIEEFMLLANREVAHFIGSKKEGKRAKTFIYRVHEEPNLEKIEIFRTFTRHLGYKMRATKNGRELSREINSLLASAKGKAEEGAIEIMALRSMARAHYSTDNVGHYGLAFDYYTHFTSPIRRYPDMMVHRMLLHYMEGGKSLEKRRYEERALYSSEREHLASDAERASIKYKMVEFMVDKVGNSYSGKVSGVTEWGLFVELEENKVEGMVPLREIKEDYFIFNEERLTLKGKSSGKEFKLGSEVKVKVTRANLEQKQLDFALVWE